MDRNGIIVVLRILSRKVALRKESVDRNILYPDSAPTNWAVALRKESVDRNFYTMQIVIIVVESLSARRAWIEISKYAL